MAGGWDGEREVVSLQSRLELSHGWGIRAERNLLRGLLSLTECAADAKAP